MTQEKIEQTRPKVVGAVELPTLDVKKYIGVKATIQGVELRAGEYGWFYYIETNALETLKSASGEEIPIKATKILGTVELEDGSIGWGNESKTELFLNSHKVKRPEELMGKTVIVQTVIAKDKKEYLTF